MFLLRSAFWLTVMFVIIAPREVDLGRAAADLSDQAMEAGRQAIVSGVLAGECTSLECAGGKAALTVLAGPTIPSIDKPMQDSSTPPVPLPRPRPDRMG